MILKRINFDILILKRVVRMLIKDFVEETDFVIEKEFTATPLARKGLNKHFVNLVTADVFTPVHKDFFSMMKELFRCSK